MKALLLDFDGVLNSNAFEREVALRPARPLHFIDPRAVARLERVLAATGARVVVTSMWQLAHDRAQLERILREHGAPSADVADVAPVLYERGSGGWDSFGIARARPRGQQINRWLARQPRGAVAAFAILDDDATAGELYPDRFVQTREEHGLQDAHADRLIALLSEPE